MQILLEQHGAKTSFERWGKDTVKRLKAFAPVDIILLDLMFPNNVTGYDIFDRIRMHAEFQHIPIVAVSASDPSVAIPKTKAKGFSGFITKPIEMDLLSITVRRAIERRRLTEQIRTSKRQTHLGCV